MTYDDVTSKERKLSGALALVMHLLFLGLLVFGFSWQKTHVESAMIVELWTSLPPLPQPIIEPLPEPPKPLPRLEPKPPPKAEPKPEIKPDIALEKERKLKEAEKKKDEEKQEKARKLKEAEEAQKKKELEDKKLAEKKAREAAVLKEKEKAKETERRLALEKEDAIKRLAQQQAVAQARVMDAYMQGIREKIRRNILLPSNMQGNPEAQFEVVQIPGGEVLNVSLKRSSGIAAYDEAVERAIRKASPLPPPPAGVAFSEVRELNLKFRPKE